MKSIDHIELCKMAKFATLVFINSKDFACKISESFKEVHLYERRANIARHPYKLLSNCQLFQSYMISPLQCIIYQDTTKFKLGHVTKFHTEVF